MSLLRILSLISLLIISCDQDKSVISPSNGTSSNEQTGAIDFRSYVKMRCSFYDSTDIPFAISIRSVDQQSSLTDTLRYLYKTSDFFQDSMLIGAIYNQEVSASCEFGIDSIIADSFSLHIYSTIIFPVGQLGKSSSPSHVISLKKSNKSITFHEITNIIEPAQGEKVLYDSLALSYKSCIITQVPTPRLVLFKSNQDEQDYLDTALIKPWSTPSNFNYSDSMIVGVITACKYSDTEFFRVVDLRKIDNKIYIEGHMYSPEWNNPIIGSWHHWIAIKNDISEMELRIRELSNLYY